MRTTVTSRLFALLFLHITAAIQQMNPLAARHLPEPLILGSASFTRKLIVREMQIPFCVVKRPIDEKSIGNRSSDKPADLVLLLANAKMDHLLHEINSGKCKDELDGVVETDFIIMTADQVVVVDDNDDDDNGTTTTTTILEKPESIDQTKQFVASYAKSPPSTVGSCVLHHVPTNIRVQGVDTATIHFDAQMPANELVDKLLLADDAPIMSCAGGLMVEHPLVKEYITRIDGTEDSVMGLSKALVLQLLDELADKVVAKK